jgi:type IX secretion system PorP/SprF family membrane protein
MLCMGLYAQQEPQFNFYMFNKVALNPASAGLEGAICGTAFGRNQWIGYKNEDGMAVNPRTYGLSLDMPVYKINSGAGLTFQYNKTGAESNIDVKLHYAYHQVIQKKHIVSFGLSLGLLGKTIDYSKVIPSEEDPLLPDATESGFMTDIDLGVHYKAFNKFYFGVSATNLLGSSAEIGAPEFIQARHFYLFSGYDLEIASGSSHDFVLTPGILVKATTGALNADLNAILTYDEFLWGGIVYRISNAAGIMAGVNYNGFKAGISYDFTMSSDFATKSRNSVEFFISYSYPIYPPVVKKSGYNTRNM